MPPVTHPFLLGINYWPKSSAMAMWSRFDEGEIDEDFAHIAALGLDVVRFFLLWEAFQPAPDRMDPGALRRFERVIALASDRGLRTMPTLFTGHMSGVNWLPAWSLDPARAAGRFRTISSGAASSYGIGDFYGGALLDAQLAHARAVGERADRHPAVLAWDLGNPGNIPLPITTSYANETDVQTIPEATASTSVPASLAKSTPLWNASSPLNGSMRSPKYEEI